MPSQQTKTVGLHAFLRVVVICASSASTVAAPPKVEILWPNGAPGAKGNEDGDRPTLAVYLPPPAQATGTAVVICPGGGYRNLAMDHEGHQVAQWLNSSRLRRRAGPCDWPSRRFSACPVPACATTRLSPRLSACPRAPMTWSTAGRIGGADIDVSSSESRCREFPARLISRRVGLAIADASLASNRIGNSITWP